MLSPMMRHSEGKGFQHLEPQIVTLLEVFLTQSERCAARKGCRCSRKQPQAGMGAFSLELSHVEVPHCPMEHHP